MILSSSSTFGCVLGGDHQMMKSVALAIRQPDMLSLSLPPSLPLSLLHLHPVHQSAWSMGVGLTSVPFWHFHCMSVIRAQISLFCYQVVMLHIRDLNYQDLILTVRIFSLCKDERTDFIEHKHFHWFTRIFAFQFGFWMLSPISLGKMIP